MSEQTEAIIIIAILIFVILTPLIILIRAMRK